MIPTVSRRASEPPDVPTPSRAPRTGVSQRAPVGWCDPHERLFDSICHVCDEPPCCCDCPPYLPLLIAPGPFFAR